MSIPYLRGYGTTRFSPAIPSATDNSPRSLQTPSHSWTRSGSRRRSWAVRWGRTHDQHRRCTVAEALQGFGLHEWVPDRQPGRGIGYRDLVISSERPEVLTLAERILVLRDGRLVGELPRAAATQESLMRMMAGLIAHS